MQVRIGYSTSQITGAPDYLIPKLIKAFTYTNKSVNYQWFTTLKQKSMKLQYWQRKFHMSAEEALEKYENELVDLAAKKVVCLIAVKDGVVYFPSGLVNKVVALIRESVDLADEYIVDLRVKPESIIPYAVKTELAQLRPYQKEAVEACLKYGQGTIEAGTGSGKTVIIQEVIRNLGLKTIVIVPTQSILNQTIKRFSEYFGKNKIGQYGDGKKNIRDITVACAASIANSAPEEWKDIQNCIFDECFPQDVNITTQDGLKTIKWIVDNKYKGNVASINPQTNKVEWKAIYDWMRIKTNKQIYRIFTSRSPYYPRVTCTEDHRFRDINNNEICAKDICPGDVIRFYPKKSLKNSWLPDLGDIQRQVVLGTLLGDSSIGKGYGRLGFNHGLKQKDYAEYKAYLLNASYCPGRVSGYTGKQLCGYQTKTLEQYKIIYDKLFVNNKRLVTLEYLKTLTPVSLAFWFMDDGGRACKKYRHANGILSSEYEYGKLHTEGMNYRSVMNIKKYFTQNLGLNCAILREKRKLNKKGYYYIILINISSFEKFSNLIAPYVMPTLRYKLHSKCRDVKFVELHPDPKDYALIKIKGIEIVDTVLTERRKVNYKYVYNFSVKDNHNYFANGFNVSNCHHTPTATIEKIRYSIIPNSYNVFGFSATSFRADGADLAIEAAVFPIIYRYSLEQGIKDGYLAQPVFMMFRVPSSSNYAGDKILTAYKNHIMRNYYLNQLVVNQIKHLLAAGKQVLVLVKEKQHGNMIQQLVPEAVFVRNREAKSEDKYIAPYVDPDQAVKQFNNGGIRCLIGSSIISEGTDILPCDALFLLTGGLSKVATLQSMGRGLRRCEDKDSVLIMDYVYSGHRLLEKHSYARMKYYQAIGNITLFDVDKNGSVQEVKKE